MLVVAKGDKLGVTEDLGAGPFGELDLGDLGGAEPEVRVHVLGGDGFAEVIGAAVGEIGKGAFG